MSKSKVTIKEIAEMAGVSIATVSHVINRTRYVRPELVDKIEKIIVETGYQNKIADKERKLLVGRESTIVAVIPNIESNYIQRYGSLCEAACQCAGISVPCGDNRQ